MPEKKTLVFENAGIITVVVRYNNKIDSCLKEKPKNRPGGGENQTGLLASSKGSFPGSG